MNLTKIKKNSDIQLPGLEVDVERIDGAIRTVTLRAGGSIVVIRGDWSGLDVAVPAPPKMVKRVRLTGTVKGLKVDELHETLFTAESRERELAEAGATPLKLEEVEVPSEEDGE